MGYVKIKTYVRVQRTPRGGGKAVNTFEEIGTALVLGDRAIYSAIVLKDELTRNPFYQISLLNGANYIIDQDSARELQLVG
jgi:hypothetical protein